LSGNTFFKIPVKVNNDQIKTKFARKDGQYYYREKIEKK